MGVYSRRQSGLAATVEVPGKDCLGAMPPDVGSRSRGIGRPLSLTPMQVFQRLGHAFSGQRMHVHGLCVLEKLVDIGHRHGGVGELSFQPPQTERCEHQ